MLEGQRALALIQPGEDVQRHDRRRCARQHDVAGLDAVGLADQLGGEHRPHRVAVAAGQLDAAQARGPARQYERADHRRGLADDDRQVRPVADPAEPLRRDDAADRCEDHGRVARGGPRYGCAGETDRAPTRLRAASARLALAGARAAYPAWARSRPDAAAPLSVTATWPTPAAVSSAATVAPTRPAPITSTVVEPRAAITRAAAPGSPCSSDSESRSG